MAASEHPFFQKGITTYRSITRLPQAVSVKSLACVLAAFSSTVSKSTHRAIMGHGINQLNVIKHCVQALDQSNISHLTRKKSCNFFFESSFFSIQILWETEHPSYNMPFGTIHCTPPMLPLHNMKLTSKCFLCYQTLLSHFYEKGCFKLLQGKLA